LMMTRDLTDVARAAVSCAGASPDGAARPEPALAAVCTTATPCPDPHTPETSSTPVFDVFHIFPQSIPKSKVFPKYSNKVPRSIPKHFRKYSKSIQTFEEIEKIHEYLPNP